MFERFTPRARAAMTHAQEQARSLGHGFVGTEHLLLGVLLEPEGVGARALVQLGANADEVKREIEHRPDPRRPVPPRPCTGERRDRLDPDRGWLATAERRSRPFVRPAMQWTMPSDPSAAARRRRVMTDVQAVLDENERLRQRLRDHRIDPDAEAGEQPA